MYNYNNDADMSASDIIEIWYKAQFGTLYLFYVYKCVVEWKYIMENLNCLLLFWFL